MTDERHAVIEIQSAAAGAFGASGAAIGLAEPERPVLRYVDRGGEWVEYPDDAFIAGRAFREQPRVVALDAGEPTRTTRTSTSRTRRTRSSPRRSRPMSAASAS